MPIGATPSLNLFDTTGGTRPADVSVLRPPSRTTDRQASFASVMARSKGEGATPAERARVAAQDLISVALVQPLLTRLREADNTAEPFKAGPGERMFRSIADAEVARRVVGSGRWALVDKVAQRLLSKGMGGPTPPERGATDQRPAHDGGLTAAKQDQARDVSTRPEITR